MTTLTRATKHTPGSWQLDDPYWDEICDSEGKHLAQVYGRGNDDEAKANAHLISAAPELFHNLIWAQHVLSLVTPTDDQSQNALIEETRKSIEATLKKARGGQ